MRWCPHHGADHYVSKTDRLAAARFPPCPAMAFDTARAFNAIDAVIGADAGRSLPPTGLAMPRCMTVGAGLSLTLRNDGNLAILYYRLEFKRIERDTLKDQWREWYPYMTQMQPKPRQNLLIHCSASALPEVAVRSLPSARAHRTIAAICGIESGIGMRCAALFPSRVSTARRTGVALQAPGPKQTDKLVPNPGPPPQQRDRAQSQHDRRHWRAAKPSTNNTDRSKGFELRASFGPPPLHNPC